MYMHQYGQGEPNWFRDGNIISSDVHTHSPLTKLDYYFFLCILYVYIYLHIYL